MNLHSNNCSPSCEHSKTFGCEQNLEEIEFEKSIFNSCVNGDLERVKYLVKLKGACILNEQDKNGYSCLHYAARNNHYEICKYLIENKAKVDLKTNSCLSTPLHRAAFIGNNKICKLLVENGADPSQKDCDSKTALHKCVEEYLKIKNENDKLKYLETIKTLVSLDKDLIFLKDKFNKSVSDIFPEIKYLS